jgi:hypothetical protein
VNSPLDAENTGAFATFKASKLTDFSAGYVMNTLTVPLNDAAAPELLEDRMVALDNEGVTELYVP